MKRTIGIALASGLALLVAGCATGGGGSAGGGGGAAGGEAAAGGGNTATASNSGVRDFNLQVKCPGIHLEKSKLNWPDDKIMSHENVSPDDIAACERWVASQPKGYVPPPPGGVPAAGGAAAGGGGQQAQSQGSAGGASPH